MILHDKISAMLPAWRERVKALINEHGEKVIDQVTIGQVYGGMRDIKLLATDISLVDPQFGIRLRGLSIPEALAALPKPDGGDVPYVGGMYYLLMVGEVPTKAQAEEVEAEWAKRAVVPAYVYTMLRAMPSDTHPMVLLCQAVLSMERDSKFSKVYKEGIKKDLYWETTLEDSLDITARMPILAAFIYRLKYGDKGEPRYDPSLDLGGNFAKMLNVTNAKEYADLSRLYLNLHSDHESGNVCAHSTLLIGSALSDPYYSFSAGLHGLAGPAHGLANQECLLWLVSLYDRFGRVPTRQELRDFAWETLNKGKVIPGYGHAVLRVTDPRFTAQLDFAKKYFPDDYLIQLVDLVYEVIPQVLKEQGKAKNPAPNVDAISGALQYHYGIRESDYYTVLFGVGRALGVTANLVWARALGQPIERPKSVTTPMLEEMAKQ